MGKERKARRWCTYCNKKTLHVVEGGANESGVCQECGSSHMTLIQGMNANLM